jgi:3-oxoacyl-[acyl-carrier protein] reductase
MIGTDDDGQNAQECRGDLVAIITGGSSGTGREVARALTSWGWAIVIVYLEHQRAAEATVDEIVAANGKVVAVRADPADELDVQRLFAESTAAFGGVDVVVHTASDGPFLLYEHAAGRLRRGGVIVGASGADGMSPRIMRRLGERAITLGRAPPDEVLPFLHSWRQTVG